MEYLLKRQEKLSLEQRTLINEGLNISISPGNLYSGAHYYSFYKQEIVKKDVEILDQTDPLAFYVPKKEYEKLGKNLDVERYAWLTYHKKEHSTAN